MNEHELSERLENLINSENGWLVKWRCENYFDDEMYGEIKQTLNELIPIWKACGNISITGFMAVVGLVDQLAGGSRFLCEQDAIKTEDASIEIMDMLCGLL